MALYTLIKRGKTIMKKCKSIVSVFVILTFMLCSLQAFAVNVPTKVLVAGVTVTPTQRLYTDTSAYLTATITPATATNKVVNWTSSNSNIVSVSAGKTTANKDGKATIKISAKKIAGTATITATTVDGKKTAKCIVTVMKSGIVIPPAFCQVRLNKTTLSLKVKQTFDLKALIAVTPGKILPKQTITYSSNATAVATVNQTTGKITAVGEGNAVITAKATCGATAICTVKVTKK
jgi:uncharacterized protein YjdB